MSADQNNTGENNTKLTEEQFKKGVDELKKIVENIKTLNGLNDRK